MKLLVNVSREDSGDYRAWCPVLPGCEVWAESKPAAEAKIRQAIEFYLASLDVALPKDAGQLVAVS